MELTQNNLQAQVKEILHKCRFSKINIIHLIRNAIVISLKINLLYTN
jgi:ABC-type nitrate/sulfonate/bicarbonate transport system ATPase subunit